MPYYATHNPYRTSGTLPVAPPTPRTTQIVSVRPPSPAESTCSSCDSSLPLNTPWSGSPTSSTFAHDQHQHQHHRSRRQSVSDGVRIVDAGESRLAPVVIHRQPNAPSPPLTYRREGGGGGRYRAGHSHAAMIEPASSLPGRGRRRDSLSGPSLSASNLALNGYRQYFSSFASPSSHHDQSRTRFPRSLVSREALDESNLPWSEDPDGNLVVPRALDRHQIDMLKTLTVEIRRKRSPKAVSFQEGTIIHEPPTKAVDYTHHVSKKTITTTTTTTPLLPGSSQEKLARAEEKAARAEDRAARLEERATITGRTKDEHEAFKARAKADERQRKVEETLLRERVKMEDHAGGGRSERTLRFQRADGRGNTVILK